jgi:hypothetical protein
MDVRHDNRIGRSVGGKRTDVESVAGNRINAVQGYFGVKIAYEIQIRHRGWLIIIYFIGPSICIALANAPRNLLLPVKMKQELPEFGANQKLCEKSSFDLKVFLAPITNKNLQYPAPHSLPK